MTQVSAHMENIRAFGRDLAAASEPLRLRDSDRAGIVAGSLAQSGQSWFVAVIGDHDIEIVRFGPASDDQGFAGDRIGLDDGSGKCVGVLIHRTPENARALRAAFPFTAPGPLGDHPVTIGCGDRLGMLAGGQIDAFQDYRATPVLAQQSVRELTRTGRSFGDVLDAASWGVFARAWHGGYGSDADRLLTPEDAAEAAAAGFGHMTLDLSAHLHPGAGELTGAALTDAYQSLPAALRQQWEARYADRRLDLRTVDGEPFTIAVGAENLARTAVAYAPALDAARAMMAAVPTGHRVDFSLSFRETPLVTDPLAHFIVANELNESGTKLFALSPHFTGRFHKGIDFAGDKPTFERELRLHAGIAARFGHRIGIHSGSDKFSVFHLIGRHTKYRFHVKTSGTSWLQALRAVAQVDPALFREIYALALQSWSASREEYSVADDLAKCPAAASVAEGDLAGLLDRTDCRQALHISFGAVLGDANIRPRLRAVLHANRERVWSQVADHLRRHLRALGVTRREAGHEL